MQRAQIAVGTIALTVLLVPATAFAQAHAGTPPTAPPEKPAATAAPTGPTGPAAEVQRNYASVKANILKSADKMPAEFYTYKPEPDIRTFARVVNHVRALEELKRQNIWIIGLDERGTPDYTGFNFNADCCLVLGAEGSGLHDLVKKTCDHLLRIPMAGSVSSLNVSVAGAVVMYESVRQRRAAPPPTAPVARKKLKGLGS